MKNPANLFVMMILLTSLSVMSSFSDDTVASEAPEPLNMIVMDPLSAPLACDCVQGYAQRKYEVLGKYLEKKLKRNVNVAWGGSLETALDEEEVDGADLIIGKHSVVLSDAEKAEIKLTPIAHLTSKKGETTQTGLIVVRKADQASKVSDLKGYRIFFGPADNEEKSGAPMALLKNSGVEIPKKLETYPACSSAATALVELDKNTKAAAVISSYAEPLLEGCGTIKKGDLRVVGVTEKVHFITAFVNQELSGSDQELIQEALFDAIDDPQLLRAIETSIGFVPVKTKSPLTTETKKKALKVPANDQSR